MVVIVVVGRCAKQTRFLTWNDVRIGNGRLLYLSSFRVRNRNDCPGVFTRVRYWRFQRLLSWKNVKTSLCNNVIVNLFRSTSGPNKKLCRPRQEIVYRLLKEIWYFAGIREHGSGGATAYWEMDKMAEFSRAIDVWTPIAATVREPKYPKT